MNSTQTLRSLPLLVLASLLAVPFGLGSPQQAWAEGDAELTEDAAEAAALVELSEPLVKSGSYFDAVRKLRKATKLAPDHEGAARLLAQAYAESGELEKAILATADHSSIEMRLLRAELLIAGGREREALGIVEGVFADEPKSIRANYLRGVLWENSGARAEALEHYILTNTVWGELQTKSTLDDDLAEARARLGIYRLTSEYGRKLTSVRERLEDILQADGQHLAALVEAGDLFLGFDKDQSAKKLYERALEQNSQYADALFGMARQRAFRYDDGEARSYAERAVAANKQHIGALLFLARMEMGDGRYEAAEKHVAAALAANPVDSAARAAKAALHYLGGRMEEYERDVEAILARDRFASEAYVFLAGVVEEQRRFQEAFELGAKAVETDPRDWDAHFLAARNALNVGEDAKAEEFLKHADEGDPFHNLYRTNFLTLFRKMAAFPTRRDKRFVLRMPPREDDAYYPLLIDTLGWSIDLLMEKWGMEPEFPLFISVFDKQEDFATRTIGLPGFPALGACFGRVVTLDSPTVMPAGGFNWKITAHHELAHVITLQLSKGRVPRWLTEGISVYEERKVSPIWNREMERDLIDAIGSDEVLTLKDINGAFRGPRVMFAYYQGGLMCELIERDFGFDKLREMVRLYGDNLRTPAVVRKALGIEPEEFDRRFLEFAKGYVADIGVLARPSRGKMTKLKRHLRRNKDDGDGWVAYATGHAVRGDTAAALAAIGNAKKALPDTDGRVPALRALVAWQADNGSLAVRYAEEAIAEGTDLFELRRGLASFYANEEKDYRAAEEHFRRAIELYPQQSGGGSLRLALAKMLLAQGEDRMDDHIALLREHVEVDQDDVAVRRRLVELYSTAGRTDDERLMLEQIRDVAPLPNGDSFPRTSAVDIHARLGDIYLASERFTDAELAFSTAVAVARMDAGGGAPPVDRGDLSDLLTRHAEALHRLGRLDEARKVLADAFTADPENEDAKDLARRLQ